MFDEDKTLKAYGSIFRWGSGLLGKTAIIVGFLMLCAFAAILRLHSDWAILGVLVLAAIFYFTWYFPLLGFCDKHPAEALLDGVQWAAHQQVMAAKGQPLTAMELSTPTSSRGAIVSNPIRRGEDLPL